MKHFYFIIILLAGVFMVGCQDQLALKDDAKPTELVTKAGADEYTAQTSERYVFPAEKDFKAWGDLPTLEDRFAACEVPENLLHAMTTDALVRTALNYPLNFIYSAYNDPFVAVDLIIKNSALYRELAVREDAAEVLLRYFDQTTIDKGNKDSVFNRSETLLTYSNEMFLDYLMASGKIPGLNDGENGKRLQAIARRKLAERQSDAKTYSDVSLSALRCMADLTLDNSQTRSGTWIYYTPFGKTLGIDSPSEMTEDEIYWLTYQYAVDYPNASVHGIASNKYNGNGYVWIKLDPTNGLGLFSTEYAWLEKGYLNQIERLWTEDFYVNANSTDFEEIYYPGADQSAIPYETSPTVYYLSKWGNGPLMEHMPSDCPYSTSSPSYFKRRSTYIWGDNVISGLSPAPLNTNTVYTLHAGHAFYRLSLEWRAENYSLVGPSPTIVYSSDSSCTVLFPEAGAYKITFEASFNNTVLYRAIKDVLCY